MKICERNSSRDIDSLPPRDQGVGRGMAELLGFLLLLIRHLLGHFHQQTSL